MGFDFDMSAEDIKVFLDEADEQLQVMEAGILRLERDASDPEHLQEIFRAAHTLKGSSATLGHRKMAEVTHSMENILDKLRKGKLSISTVVVDTLFACLDVLVAFKDEIATGQESGITTDEILERLASIDQGQLPAAPVSAAAAPTGGVNSLPGVPPLSAVEQERLSAAHGRGLHLFLVHATLDKNSPMPGVRAFQLLLAAGDLGEVIRSWPTMQEVESDHVSDEVKLLLATGQTPQKVTEVLQGVPETRLSSLSPLGLPTAASTPSAALPAAPAAEVAAALLAEEPAESLTATVPAEKAGAGGAKGKTARTVRVDVDVLDNLMNLVGEMVIARTRLHQVLSRLEVERDGDELTQVMSGALANIGRLNGDLQDQIQRARMLPVDNLFRKFPRMVRDVAQKAGKEIEFIVLGEETELDRSVIEEIGDPLMHLLRNAVDHGVEPPAERLRVGKPAKGQVILEAFHEENHIIISVKDDGRGIDPNRIRASAVRKGLISEEAARRMPDPEVINLIWAPGFSTADKVSEVSGRGVGLDVVHKNIEKLNGSVEIKSEPGMGTEFRVKLPLTLAIIRSLQVQVLDTTYCIPLSSVVETDRIPVSSIQTVRQREVIVKRGDVIPLVRLIEAFELERPAGYVEEDELFVVIVAVMGKQIGIVVDNLVGEGEVVIKPLGKFIGDVPGISGATIMGDGDVAIILDVSSLINTVQAELNRREASRR